MLHGLVHLYGDFVMGRSSLRIAQACICLSRAVWGGPQLRTRTPRPLLMPPLPQVSRSNSQHQIAARADTFIHSARAASHLEATVSCKPVTAHADTKPVQVPFFILGGHQFLKHPNHSPEVWSSEAEYRCPAAGPQVSVLFNLVAPLRSRALVRCPRGRLTA
ncbi:hypothetical protein NDU88_007650 [Pleurodeles waltl]|uniref:Uncharacterized protein n=1 Tax=Pleurodeles waltl TaxID=8319 RepID=A0AAV7PPZ3_PLEWA|nr:hypothetical protein NDU88_007650 [Pleurodeles waltl]